MRIFTFILRWLSLVFMGWLFYGFGKALWVYIRLGAPLYDWQWYPAVIFALAFGGVCTAWRVPPKRVTVAVVAVLLLWFVLGFGGFGGGTVVRPSDFAPAPISFWAPRETQSLPDSLVDDVRAAGGRFYITVEERHLEGEMGERLAERLRRVSEHGIEIYLCAHVSDYLSVPVYDEWEALVRKTIEYVEREKLEGVRGIIGDAECPMHTPRDPLGLRRREYHEVIRRMEDLMKTMREDDPGLVLGMTATWDQWVDGIDGDDDLQLIQRSPVDPPGEWGYESVMVYSSYLPPSARAYYTYAAERAMARRYPDRPLNCLVGVVGFPKTTLLDYDELVRDARISRTLGADEIVVFFLGGAVRDFGEDFVGRFVADVNDAKGDEAVRIEFSRRASIYLFGLMLADALFDGLYGRMWLLASWAAAGGIIVILVQRRKRGRRDAVVG